MIPKEKLYDMYWVHGMTLTKIAGEFGVSRPTVSNQMKKYGIETRTLSESKLIESLKPPKKELYNMYWKYRMSQEEIAENIGVSHSTIFEWMKEYEIESRTLSESSSNKISILSKDKLQHMYLKKEMSQRKIANEVGVSHKTVDKWMKKHGIKSRTRSESLVGRYTGENASNWNGGTSFEPYCNKFNNTFKEEVRVRDDYTCQLCRYEQKLHGTKLSIHHIHYDKENCYPDVVALCQSCNAKVNSNRDYWEQFFENQLLERGLYCWSLS